MSEALTLEEMAPALRALRLIVVECAHLPAPFVHLSPVDGARVELSLHYVDLSGDTFNVFEMWREALGMESGAVTFRVQSNGRTRVLRVTGPYGGAEVMLTAYATAPAAAVTTAGGAA
ncbi:hypothetical protein [Streptomyces sp. CBMA29]|uniref:hypothetical protein n=1 Tax=Streptomyces sp. CBMA29 TaxID=1896314 RepID=UPI001661FFFB|nr:hypothetical protein [Streptomyces sp. CBMA29]MBD0735770.1 hypothetical protein [Streptomyces sp. CBMA29]